MCSLFISNLRKFLHTVKPIQIIFLVLTAIFGIFAVLIAKDRIQALNDSDNYSAIVVECDSRSSQRRNRRSGRPRSSSRTYTPVAVSKEGFRATGNLWVTGKSLCERMIGHETRLLVDRQNPESARINSFLQFWFFPVALIFSTLFVLAQFARLIKLAVGLFVGFFLLTGAAVALEFRVFDEPAERVNINPVDSNLALQACIKYAMNKEGIRSADELIRLSCKKRGLTDLTGLAQLASLEELDLSSNPIDSLEPLAPLQNLRVLQLEGTKALVSLHGLEQLIKLESLAAHCSALREINAVKNLVKLQHLDVSCNHLTDISPIAALHDLVKVAIDDNTRLSDISPLANKPRLEIVTMYHTPVNDISPLIGNDKLRTINIGNAGDVPCMQISRLRDRLVSNARIRGPKHCQK